MPTMRRWTPVLILSGIALTAIPINGAFAQDPTPAASPTPAPAPTDQPPGADVTVAGSLLFRFRAASGGMTPQQRADAIQNRLIKILSDPKLKARNILVVPHGDNEAAILARKQLLVTVTVEDGKANQQSATDLANAWAERIRKILPKMTVKPNPNSRGPMAAP